MGRWFKGCWPPGAKARTGLGAYAALKRRSSTVLYAFPRYYKHFLVGAACIVSQAVRRALPKT